MRFVDSEESKKEYKDFLEKHERCNFQQSLEWAEVKKPNWKPEVILAEDKDGNIIGSLCVWIRKMPIFGNIMYSSRGPVCDIHDIAVMKQLTDGAKELAKKYKAIVLRMEPDILSEDENFRDIVTSLGYRIKDDAKDFKDEIQPRYVFRLDIKDKTEEEVMAGFKQKWRYNIRLAGKKGVTIKEGTKEDLKDFYSIVMPKVEKVVKLKGIEEKEIEKYKPQKLAVKVYLDFDESNFLIADVKFCYSEEEFNPLQDNVKINALRNELEENRNLNIFQRTGFMLDVNNLRFILPNNEQIYNFLENDINLYMQNLLFF